jgi:hypothetical protein
MSDLMRHVIIKDNLIVNIIDYFTDQVGTCPDGLEDVIAIANNTAQIGWLYEAGEFIDTTPIVIPSIIIPQSITMRQARLWLAKNNLLSQVDAIISSLIGTEGDLAKIEWEYATTLDKSNALFQQIASQLNFTEEQIDNFFIEAFVL